MERAPGSTALLSEEIELEASALGVVWLTGAFSASLQGEEAELDSADGLPVEAALAWARARSGRVWIRLGHGAPRWAGDEPAPSGAPSWPPDDLPRLVRRRHPDWAYLDRRPDAPAIAWAVSLWLAPPAQRTAVGRLVLPVDLGEVAAVARAAGAEWDDDALRVARHDRAHATEAEGGWMTYGRDAARLRVVVSASTHDEALARGRAALGETGSLEVEEATALPVGHPGHDA